MSWYHRESRKEESRLQMYLKESDSKVGKLNLEIMELRKKLGLMAERSDVEKTPPLPVGRVRSDTPKAKPPMRKETFRRRDKNSIKAPSVAESFQECDDHLLTISKCDEKIARFEELLKQMRTDLYGSLEAISDKITQTAVNVDPPKRRGSQELLVICNWFRHAQHHNERSQRET